MTTSEAPSSLPDAAKSCRVMDRSSVFALPRFQDPTISPIGRCFFLYSPSQILKLGSFPDEAFMTKFAHEIMGEKSPRLVEAICLADKPDIDYGIIISRLPGKPLVELWPCLNDEQRTQMKTRLAEMLVFMREPREGINFYGRPNSLPYALPNLYDPRKEHIFCRSRSEWDASRIQALKDRPTHIEISQERLLELEQIQRVTGAHDSALVDRPVFTHGDLSARNFLVDPDTLELTGMIDWETSNVMPAYFEFIQARLSGGHDPFWRTEILEVLELVLRIECDRAIAEGKVHGTDVKTEELFRETLAAWKAFVDLERPAQGKSDRCYWTFEEKDEETRRNWDWD